MYYNHRNNKDATAREGRKERMEMKKYIAIVDFKSATGKGFGHVELDAKTVLEAMDEAAKLKDDNVYLIKIAEKSGKTEKREGAKRTKYSEILCYRSHGWHPCTNENSESANTWERAEYTGFVDYQLA